MLGLYIRFPLLFGQLGLFNIFLFVLGPFLFDAFLVLFLGMPVGEWLARRISAKTFDRAMLALLAVISTRLVWGAVF